MTAEPLTPDALAEFVDEWQQTGGWQASPNLVNGLVATVDALTAEVERLKTEGTPGVMHEVDRAFYKLTVKERDAERHKVDALTAELQAWRDECDTARNVIRRLARVVEAAEIRAATGEVTS